MIICILHVYTQNAPGLNRAIAVALNLSSVEKGDRELQCTRRLGTLYGLEDKLRVFFIKKENKCNEILIEWLSVSHYATPVGLQCFD